MKKGNDSADARPRNAPISAVDEMFVAQIRQHRKIMVLHEIQVALLINEAVAQGVPWRSIAIAYYGQELPSLGFDPKKTQDAIEHLQSLCRRRTTMPT
jgi:hypothetical protein